MPPCSPVPGSMSLQRPPESGLCMGWCWAGPPSARTGCALLRYSQLSSHQPPASPGDTHLTSPREQTFLPHQWGFGRQIEIFGRFLTFLSILYLNFKKKSYSSVPSVSVHTVPLHSPV